MSGVYVRSLVGNWITWHCHNIKNVWVIVSVSWPWLLFFLYFRCAYVKIERTCCCGHVVEARDVTFLLPWLLLLLLCLLGTHWQVFIVILTVTFIFCFLPLTCRIRLVFWSAGIRLVKLEIYLMSFCFKLSSVCFQGLVFLFNFRWAIHYWWGCEGGAYSRSHTDRCVCSGKHKG